MREQMPASDNKKSKVILVVDDNDLVLRTLSEILSDYYDVITASSGSKSITLAQERNDIACVLMDVRMPDVDGVAAMKEIHDINPKLPVILHTAYPGEHMEGDLKSGNGAFAYIIKGDSIAELLDSIKAAVKSYNTLPA